MMKNNDIYNYFSNCVDQLIDIAKQKLNDANEKIEKERKFKQDSKESRDKMQDAINRINEVLEYDLTTPEGYSKYMEYLADLRKRVKDYNNIIKVISGQTAEEMIDDIAQKATDIYLESESIKKEKKEKEEKEEKAKKESESEVCINNQTKENKADDIDKHGKSYGKEIEDEVGAVSPSRYVDDDTLESIVRIVDKYINTNLKKIYGDDITAGDLEWLTDELVEYTCWLQLQKV